MNAQVGSASSAQARPAQRQRQHHTSGSLFEVAPGVACLAQSFVNLYFIGPRKAASRQWVLVDAGLPYSAGSIARAAARWFGPESRPAAIVLTHGHFDHVGGLVELAEAWNVPVYTHPLELPYITGRSSYPPPDPAAGGGMMSLVSPLFPRGPVDVGRRALALPADHSLPGLPDWRWVETPGHSPGHVALFRDSDGTLLAGDAFVTARQESLIGALLKQPLVWRPPAYYTCDWDAAFRSVQRLADLRPNIAATGHGRPLAGEALRRGLAQLIEHWEEVAPRRGRYVDRPALTTEEGTVGVPPPVIPRQLVAGLGIAAAALMGWQVWRRTNERY